ncbi:RNA-binding protein spenito-like [Armigeres subalbatus]|uniref:RNA-binding protein spenito-like n=1 Tax=Armigeres subalbatus TaxID=124917 RepID=UPI002ED0923F
MVLVCVGELSDSSNRRLNLCLQKQISRFENFVLNPYRKHDMSAYILQNMYDSIDAATTAVKEMRGFLLGAPDRRIRIDFADNGTTPSFSKSSGGFEEGGMACYRMQERYQKLHGNLPQSGKGR